MDAEVMETSPKKLMEPLKTPEPLAEQEVRAPSLVAKEQWRPTLDEAEERRSLAKRCRRSVHLRVWPLPPAPVVLTLILGFLF